MQEGRLILNLPGSSPGGHVESQQAVMSWATTGLSHGVQGNKWRAGLTTLAVPCGLAGKKKTPPLESLLYFILPFLSPILSTWLQHALLCSWDSLGPTRPVPS